MNKLIIALPLLVSMFAMHAAYADPVVVIVNSANTQDVSMADVKNILSSAQNKQSITGKLLNDPTFALEMENALKNLNKTLEIINSDRLKIGINLKNKK